MTRIAASTAAASPSSRSAISPTARIGSVTIQSRPTVAIPDGTKAAAAVAARDGGGGPALGADPRKGWASQPPAATA